MSNDSAPISISGVATALRAATTDNVLVLRRDTLGSEGPAKSLLTLVRTEALELSGVVVTESETSLIVTGTTSVLGMTGLVVTLTLSAAESGSTLSLRATLDPTRKMELPALPALGIGDVVIAIDIRTTSGVRSRTGSLSGTVQLGSRSVPVSIALPPDPDGWVLSYDFPEADRPGIGALTQLVSGLDVLPSIPPGLVDALKLRSFELALQQRPHAAFTISAPTWDIIPGTLAIAEIELFVLATLPTPTSAGQLRLRLQAMLDAGSMWIPITLEQAEGGSGWTLSLDVDYVPLPGLSDLAKLLGGAQTFDSMFPGLGSFGGMGLTDLRVDLTPSFGISAVSFRGTTAAPWTLPMLGELSLREATVALSITNPLSASRVISGTVNGVIVVGGREFMIGGDKSPGSPWQLSGRQLEEDPISLTGLASDFLGVERPADVPDFSFVDLEASLVPATGEFSLSGRSSAQWIVPLGFTDLGMSNIRLLLARSLVNGAKKVSLQVGGDFNIGGVAVSLGLTLPGGFALSAALPAVKLSEVLTALGGGTVLQGLGLPASFFDLTLGPSTIGIDATAKTATLSGSAAGFGALELTVRRDAQGKIGAALALAPRAGVDLQSLLGVPGLGGLALTDLVFVLSSLQDPALRFSAPAFASVGRVMRGFGFAAKVTLPSFGAGASVLGLPSTPIAMQARFGRSLSDFTLSAAMSAPGGRIVLDAQNGIALIDPELRFSPGTMEFALIGSTELFLDGTKLLFTGGVKLGGSGATLFAEMDGDWRSPFGISGVVARDLALVLTLPAGVGLSGGLQIGRQSGALTVQVSPTAPVFQLLLTNLDLHDLIASVCDPALTNLPANFRQTLSDIRIRDAEIYVAPKDTEFGTKPCPAGVSVRGKMSLWGLDVDARVRTVGSGATRALLAEGLISLPDLGGLLVLKGGQDANGAARSGPYMKLDLQPGKTPVVLIAAAIEVLGAQGPSVDIQLDDSGFRGAFSGRLMGGKVGARLEVSGSRLGPNAKYALAVEVDASSIGELLNKVQSTLTETIAAASQEITKAKALLAQVQERGLALTQSAEDQRRAIQDQRNADTEKLRQAERDLQQRSAEVDALLRSIESARAQVRAERAEVDRRIAAAQNDVNAARAAVSSLNNEINSTDRWFHSLPKIDVPWKPSRAREGMWFGIKMGGLYVARDSANAGLNIANSTLQGIRDAQRSFPIDVDPRVAALLSSHITAQGVLQAAQSTVEKLRSTMQLIPIEADFRMVALRGLKEAQNLQLVAAKAALDLAQSTLTGIASIGSAFVPSILIKRAYFSGELSVLKGGKVRLGVVLVTPQGQREFTIAYDLNDPLASAAELINRLLGTDTQKALATVTQSTAAATDSVVNAERKLLPDDTLVNLRCVQNNQLVRVTGKNLLRFGDTVSLRAEKGQYLVSEADGTMNANRTTMEAWTRFVLLKPDNLNSRDFVHYGDDICLKSSHGRYLVADADQYIRCTSTTLGVKERWKMILPSDPSARDEVDASQPFGLKSCLNNFMGAWEGGGGGLYGHINYIGGWESWTVVPPDWSVNNYCMVTRPDSSTDPACQFRIKRSGDWMGFQSVKFNLFISMKQNGSVRVDTTNFADPGHTWEHFRTESGALFSQGQSRYLHFGDHGSDHPQFLHGDGTDRNALSCLFEIVKAYPEASSLTTADGPPKPLASDLAFSAQQQATLAGRAAAGDGPTAESTAAQQAMQLRAGGESAVAPDRLTVAQSDEARLARRARAIEKAARGLRESTEDFRDGALRFDGKSYLEAPATRAVLREQSTVDSALLALPADTIVTIRCQSSAQLVQVTGKSPLRYGAVLSLRASSNHYLVAEADGAANANRTAIGDWERWTIQNPRDVGSTDFVRYGDQIALRSHHGKYLAFESNNSSNASHSLDDAARWTLLCAGDTSRIDEVDTSLPIWLRTSRSRYLGATNGGGAGTTASDQLAGSADTFTLIAPAALDYSLIVRAGDPQNPACQFRIKRYQDFTGLQSVKSNLYVATDTSLMVRAASPNFAGPDFKAEHFRAEDAAFLNQNAGRYLRAAPGAANAPLFVDCAATNRDVPEAAFELVRLSDGVPLRGASGVQSRPIIELGSQFTIEAWICPESLGGARRTLISKWRDSDEDEVQLYLTEEGRLALSWHVSGVTSRGTSGFTSCQSDETVKLDAWSHVAAVRDGDTVSLYIDGRRAGGAQGLGSAPLRVGACSWRIGAQEGSTERSFIGLIDSIRIWGTACSAATLRGQRYLVSRGNETKLLACWNLDEESGDTAFDASPSELHARLLFGVRRVIPGAPEGPPLPDRHLTLGGNAHVLVGELDLFGGSTAMTIETWVRVDRITEDFTAILSKWGQSAEDEYLFALTLSGKLAFAWHTQGGTAYNTPGWRHILSDGTVPLERWCHVAVVRDKKTIGFYCDGALIGTSDSADEQPLRRGTTPICIGSERGVIRKLQGSLAELRVWKRAFTAPEIRDQYRRPLSGDEPGLSALWQLDEGFGTILRDATPSARHGTLGGPGTWPGRGGPPRVVGPTRGLQLNGAQHVAFGDEDSFTPSFALTVESWVRIDSITEDYSSIVNKWKATNEYLFGVMPDRRLVFTWRTQGPGGWGTPSWGQTFSTTLITLGRWTHVAAVRAGQTVSFFIDGQLAGSADVVDLEPFINSTAPLHIGGESGGAPRYLRGTIAGLRIWRTARTHEQLAASMAGLVSSRAPGRILDLRCDEGEGTTVLDAATGRLGQLVGSPLPTFVPVTLPVRSAGVIPEDPSDIWLQPALEIAKHCQAIGRQAAAAIPDVDAALAQLERSSPETIIALLAKAGYGAKAIAEAEVSVWAHQPAEVAQKFCEAGRPASEALVATSTALGSASAAAQVSTATLLSTAGYSPESISAALLEAWGHDPRSIAKLLRDAGLTTTLGARAVWTALAQKAVPCFAELAENLIAAGHQPGEIGKAMNEYWGCDPSTISRAMLRAGGSATAASAAAAGAGVMTTTVLRPDQLREVKCERSNTRQTYNFSTRSTEEAAAAGFTQQFVSFVAYATPQWGTVPIYRETLISAPGTEYHFWNRTAAEAAAFNWQQLEVAFYAFATQVPGTVPVYREEGSFRYFFSVRTREVATLCGSNQLDVAFYAYPPETLNPPRTISLRVYSGQYVHLDSDEKTLVAKRTGAGGWESFSQIDLGQNRIALRAKNGKYVSAENGGGGKLFATSTPIGRNETFLLSDLGSGSVALAASNGQYVSSDVNAGGVPLVANRGVRIGLETFGLVKQPETFAWEAISGNLTCVSVATDGTVWGVNSNGAIFRRDGSVWSNIPGSLAQISVGSAAHVWGVNANGAIFRWNGTGWENIPGVLSHVSVASDGAVWGVNPNDVIFRWTGSAWVGVPGALRQISVGSASLICGANANGDLYRWNGSSWSSIPGTMKYISVAADGTIFAITPTNGLCRYSSDGTWEHLAANLKQVSVCVKGHLMGVDPSGAILRGTVR